MEFLIPIIILFGLIYFLYKANQKINIEKAEKINQQLEEEKRIKNQLILEQNYNYLIENEDTETTFKQGQQIIHGGPLNHSHWSFQNTLKFISKYNLKSKHLNIEKFYFDKISKEIKSNTSLTYKLEKIASQSEYKSREAKNLDEVKETIDKINKIKKDFISIKFWLIKNIENILIENAKKGLKLPYTLIFNDHYKEKRIEVDGWLYLKFSKLGLTHPSPSSFDNRIKRNAYNDEVFKLISSNTRLEKFLYKRELEYSTYSRYGYIDGIIIFRSGQRKNYKIF